MEHVHHMSEVLPASDMGENPQNPAETNKPSKQEEIPRFDVVEVLKKYRECPVPAKGQTMEFKLPLMNQLLQFSRPSVDEEEEALCDWSLPIAFYMLPKKHLFKLFVACLLEKKIAIMCRDMRVLSSLVFSFIPLMRPFIYQSVIIPIIPAKLNSLVDAPVPFIIGFPQRPHSIPDDVIIYDVDDKRNPLRIPEELPNLPRMRDFELGFTKLYNELMSTYEGKTPYATTSKQLRLAKKISHHFSKYLSSLFDNFRECCMRDVSVRNKPITIFVKERFLEGVPKEHLTFYNMLMNTQMFFDFQDKRLRREDGREL
jgi:hypothetical protein